MKGLLLRLSAVDSDAEAAVRVIAYFDELVTHRATTADLVRATAALAECVAGLQRGGEPALRFRSDGSRAAGPGPGVVATLSGRLAGEGGPPAEPLGGEPGLGDARDGTRATGTAPRATAGPGEVTSDGAVLADPRPVTTGFGSDDDAPTPARSLGGMGASHAKATNHGDARDDNARTETRTPANGPRGLDPAAPRVVLTDLGDARDDNARAETRTSASGLRGEALAAQAAEPTNLADAHEGNTRAEARTSARGSRDEARAASHGEATNHGDASDDNTRTSASGLVPAAPRVVATDLGGEAAGRVWLERDGEPGPLDDLVLERFAIAARVLGPAPQGAPPHLADPALVELVLGERAAEEDRARALVLLGLDVGRPLRVVAVGTEDGRDPGAAAVALVARGGTSLGARVAVVGEVAAVLVQPREGPGTVVRLLENALSLRARERGSSGNVRVGVGDAASGLDARRSWLQARLAERFAVPATEPLVVHENLGSLTLLAEIPADHLRAQPDVRALDALAPPDLEALEAFCRTGSLRQAAVALHRHHSSVATRLAHVEDALGWPLDDPASRFRTRLALLARRLAHRT
ncbi:PucR family transcriptional regulator [Amycolatopsis sp. CA-161197]|uniref:PucR family transcriptional regulator n=1 Tax=Amycolatopsis sp. CA-161197 TaxID=3239922 RepID=UPI003D8A5653